MKIVIHILSLIALSIIIYNFTKVDFDAPFQGDSITAIITIIAALCAILLLQILRVSKKIEQKSKY
jgi:uncharacterized membrane protein